MRSIAQDNTLLKECSGIDFVYMTKKKISSL